MHDRTILAAGGRRTRRSRPLALLLALAAFGSVATHAAEHPTWVRPPEPRRVLEKNANLDISLRLAGRLRSEGITVVLTRQRDATRAPGQRAWVARNFHADAFVSVHNNWVRNPRADWSEIYRQRDDALSAGLAESMADSFERVMGARSKVRTRPGRHGDYYWQLRQNRMPSIIVESAFVSNRRQAWLLGTSTEYRQRIADAIAGGVIEWQRSLGAPHPNPPYPAVRVPSALVPSPTSIDVWVRGRYDVRVYWTGSTRAQRYYVYRDGELVGIVGNPDFTPARALIGDEPIVLSFADRWTAPGQSYRYEVIAAIDAAAGTLESRPRAIAATTPPITVCIDPGHGGAEPGAVGGW